MWFFVLWFLLSVILILAIQYIKSEKTFKKFPPGPPRLPILGSLPQFIWEGGSVPSHAYDKLAAKYGSIFAMKLGSVPAIVLNSYEAIQSIAFHEDVQVHLDKDETWLLAKSKGIPSGLFFNSPNQWKEQLGIAHKLFRKYGFKTSKMTETLFMSEMAEFCKDLKNSVETNGEVFRIFEQLHAVFFNVTWGFITGERCEKGDPFLSQVVHATENFVGSAQFGGGIHNIFPELVRWFPRLTGLRGVQKVCDEWFTILEGVVKKYRKLGNYKTNPTNMIEDYLLLVDTHGNENANPKQTIYTDFHIVGYIQDLFLAGIDTQSHAVKFMLRCFVKYPEVQEKIRQEVEQVIGKRMPTTDDINGLIYTQAALLEVFRLDPIVEITLRKIWRDTKFQDYELPKGTMVYSNVYAANRQESIWQNATTFQPERFIDTTTGKIINSEKILTFGFGKRPCMGEVLAKRSMVLAAALLVQQFIFSEDPLTGIPDDKDVIHSISQDLPPFNVIVKIRN